MQIIARGCGHSVLLHCGRQWFIQTSGYRTSLALLHIDSAYIDCLFSYQHSYSTVRFSQIQNNQRPHDRDDYLHKRGWGLTPFTPTVSVTLHHTSPPLSRWPLTYWHLTQRAWITQPNGLPYGKQHWLTAVMSYALKKHISLKTPPLSVNISLFHMLSMHATQRNNVESWLQSGTPYPFNFTTALWTQTVAL